MSNMNRNTALIVTVATSVLCGCPGFGACLWGMAFGIGGFFGGGTLEVNGVSQPMDPTQALLMGVGGICGGIILVAIPVVVGFLTLRNAKAA